MVASIAFLWLWNYLGFHLIDMRDLVITILWWIITIGLCIAIHIAEKRRRERIRTIFISDGVPYEFVIHSAHRNPDDGRVWEGDVVQVSGPRDSLPFSNAQELSKILSSQPV